MVTISCVGLVVRGRFEQFFHIGDVLTASEAEPRPVKILTRSAIALIGAALISGQAIGGNLPHDLSPGVCAEDIGDRLTVQSHASGLATVEFRPLNDVGIFSK